MRAHRLQFWPDRRDQTARRIARFLHDGDLSVLEPLRFTKSSAVLQGLPALERMIHDDDHTGKILASGEDGALRPEGRRVGKGGGREVEITGVDGAVKTKK